MWARGRRFISGDAMPVITIKPAGVSIEVAAGSTLLEAIRASGHAIGYVCDGYGDCGSCHVYIHQGRTGLSGMRRAEDARLDNLAGVSSASRLACQVTLKNEDITVELLGIGPGR